MRRVSPAGDDGLDERSLDLPSDDSPGTPCRPSGSCPAQVKPQDPPRVPAGSSASLSCGTVLATSAEEALDEAATDAASWAVAEMQKAQRHMQLRVLLSNDKSVFWSISTLGRRPGGEFVVCKTYKLLLFIRCKVSCM